MKAGMLRGVCGVVAGFVLAGLFVAMPSQAGPGPLASAAAKKKCKPKVAYGAGAKKKKKCKKRKSPPIVLPGADPLAPSTPSVATTRERARVTWSAVGKDIDFHVWDQLGRHTYYAQNEIPGALHGGDVVTSGFETFTDQQWLVPVPAGGNRVFTYGLCLNDTGPISASLTVLLPDGSPFTQPIPSLAQGAGQLIVPASGYTPPNENDWCS